MRSDELLHSIREQLPFDVNTQQEMLLAALADFCLSTDYSGVFLLNGYAGTGKTSVIGALVRALKSNRRGAVLMAPTGRAAKVFSRLSGSHAQTIHRLIYRNDPESPVFGQLKENKSKGGTIFIVDEASMIGDDSINGNNLLGDLISYVYGTGKHKMILLGDTAQLPPVGLAVSPAMNPDVLRSYGLKVSRATITETVRQSMDSGILFNATWLRRAMLKNPLPLPMLRVTGFGDVHIIDRDNLQEAIADSIRRHGTDETVILTRSNKMATRFNLGIRALILDREEVLSTGDKLMVVKNNYFWATGVKGLDFIANGDMAIVKRVKSTEKIFGHTFADVEISFPDNGDITLDVKLLIDTLTTDTPSLSIDEMRELGAKILDRNKKNNEGSEVPFKPGRLRDNPYYNALQVKFGYAVTCHKAQGGQWESVFVDMGNIAPEALGIEFYRWLYTSTTRATLKINFITPGIKIL